MKITFRLVAMVAATVIGGSAFAQSVTSVIRLKGKIQIQDLANDVRNPMSPRYGKPYAPDEIRELAGPSEEDYSQLLSSLKQKGFAIVQESPTHLWVGIKGEASVFDNVFGTHLMPSGKFLKNFSTAAAPEDLSLIESVGGLDNARKSRPRVLRQSSAPTATPGGIPQATIKSAYDFNSIYQAGLSGKGQDIAVATYGGFNIDDIKFFYSYSGVNPSIDQVTFNGTPAYNEDAALETQLDAEFSGMMAPGANIHVFASATNDDAGELSMFTAILDDNRAKVVNYSWGDCEKNLTPAHQSDMGAVFARAVAQGVNIMVASGDNGSDSCNDKTTQADWPAANPDVVAVGGTSFNGSASGPRETAWNKSGGGISALFDLPSWQASLGTPYVKRSYPDVAFNADPKTGQAIYGHISGVAGWIVIGGTSMAAPQWSGFLALVGEARQSAGKATLGYLNPIIYGLSLTQRNSTFNDVTSGSNGAYSAGAGWDAVTGLGSMQAANLLSVLAGN